MTSEVAHAEATNTALLSTAPLVNGEHDRAVTNYENAGAFDENADLSKIGSKPDPSNQSPIEGNAPGITPVADFLPKNAPVSHPTPPPDEPLVTSDAFADVTPAADTASLEFSAHSIQSAAASSEPSLVRPREEDDEETEEGPAAKRTKVELESTSETITESEPAGIATAKDSPDGQVKLPLPSVDEDTTMSSAPDAQSAQLPTSSDDVPDGGDAADGPLPKPLSSAQGEEPVPAALPNPTPVETKEIVPPSTPLQDTAELVPTGTSNPVAPVPAHPSPATQTYSKAPMTTMQSRFLLEKTKNLKKTKNSLAFLNPVDPVALNIPQYPEIVKNPMDLTTMEHKLKSGMYSSVQEYADDFFLIIHNARLFNGAAHPVAQAGQSMEAYFRKMLESVPSADAPTSKTQIKRTSPKPPSQASRRESRSAVQATNTAQPVPATGSSAPGASEAFALQPDGTPQIRRDSTINRPARAIKPPARELTYSKPKRKEHHLELKFCEHVLVELRSPRYSNMNHVFLAPVDPVALNIPHYRQIVKHPMDLSSMAQKLKQGQYSKATEFRKDFDLMISNCLAFNPVGNPVRDIGIQFQREFEALWKTKEKWERNRKAESLRAQSASGDDESAEEDEDEEEEENVEADPQSTIRALQKQLAEMQNALAGLNKPTKQTKAKAKSGAKPSKKATGMAVAPKQKHNKSKPPKKIKQVTYEEKQEISEAVSKMNGPQVEELTKIITSNCKKYADQEEMELEIDDLPNDVQVMLLKYVRGIFGNPGRGGRAASPDDIAAFDDDDFEPERSGRKGGGSSKRKKHKPMGKKEQQDAIDTLQRKLSQFNGAVTSGSQSPNSYAVHDETSGDEESEESEEE